MRHLCWLISLSALIASNALYTNNCHQSGWHTIMIIHIKPKEVKILKCSYTINKKHYICLTSIDPYRWCLMIECGNNNEMSCWRLSGWKIAIAPIMRMQCKYCYLLRRWKRIDHLSLIEITLDARWLSVTDKGILNRMHHCSACKIVISIWGILSNNLFS